MKTSGEILREARIAKNVDFPQVESATKIRTKYLRALEENDYGQFFSYPFARGLMKNYAEYLNLPSRSILAIFRRDFGQTDKGKIVLPPVAGLFGKKNWVWTPKMTLISSTLIFFLLLVGYLGFQYFSLNRKPGLEIIFPEDKAVVNSQEIELSGRVNKEATLTVNGSLVLVNPDGNFHYRIDLFPGENKIVIEAISPAGKKSSAERTLFRLDKEGVKP